MNLQRSSLMLAAIFLIGCGPKIDAERVFRNEEHMVSFRYPSMWDSVPPQAATTLVMLHARDGSFATCNLSVREADRRTIDEMDESYWNNVLSKALPKVQLRSLRMIDAVGGRRAVLEYDFELSLPSGVTLTSSLTLIALRNGRRYMLVLNAKRERIDALRPTFDLMAGSLMFDSR